MASTSKQMGQVFTPVSIVHAMLDSVGYTADKDLRSIKLLEPSFGEAVFLSEAVKRLISSARTHEITEETLPELILECLWGVELDEELYLTGLENVKQAAANLGVVVDNLNLHHMDAFDFTGKFDIVIGNPPYVRVHNLVGNARQRIETMNFSAGSTDLYILFFELGLDWIKDDAQLIYITPNSFLRNSSQKAFRDYLISEKLLVEVKDFGAKKVFPTAATYTSITHLKKINTSSSFVYKMEDTDEVFETSILFSAIQQGEPWSFQNKTNTVWLADVQARKHPLHELGAAQNGLATLRDRIFIMGKAEALERRLEPKTLKPIVKASTYKGGEIDNVIIYPYDENRKPYTEVQLSTLFPNTYKYLLFNKEELLKRDTDKGSNWFQYGRSQGLSAVGKKKLVLSHVMRPQQKNLPVWVLDEDVLVYSGMFIIPQPSQIDTLQTILASDDFARFATLHGKNMSGGYRSFGTKTLNSYRWV